MSVPNNHITYTSGESNYGYFDFESKVEIDHFDDIDSYYYTIQQNVTNGAYLKFSNNDDEILFNITHKPGSPFRYTLSNPSNEAFSSWINM